LLIICFTRHRQPRLNDWRKHGVAHIHETHLSTNSVPDSRLPTVPECRIPNASTFALRKWVGVIASWKIAITDDIAPSVGHDGCGQLARPDHIGHIGTCYRCASCG